MLYTWKFQNKPISSKDVAKMAYLLTSYRWGTKLMLPLLKLHSSESRGAHTISVLGCSIKTMNPLTSKDTSNSLYYDPSQQHARALKVLLQERATNAPMPFYNFYNFMVLQICFISY
jgi:hypothetical protein